ncbi:MAG: discoidin domain-containing protein [Verrucomicrobia bacterium]|nr:discoidin domain-containing protein [Verrucomicrobiota bacterium]MCH8510335.1 discoidin domain-containing protein [Kiritimatiellia bacterium]
MILILGVLLNASLLLPGLHAGENPTNLKATLQGELDQFELEKELRILQMRPHYLGQLEVLYERARAAGDLQALQAVMAEQERFEKDSGLPDPLSEDPGLQDLQKKYGELMRQYERDRREKELSALRKYDQALLRVERKLTSEDQIEKALAVREIRNGLKDRMKPLEAQKEPTRTAGHFSDVPESTGLFRNVESSTPKGEVFEGHFMHHAFDGNPRTRWQGNKLEGEWISASFRSPQHVRKIQVVWEVAHAKSYDVYLQIDGRWIKVAEERDGKIGAMEYPVNHHGATGIKIENIKSATHWPPSIFNVFVE